MTAAQLERKRAYIECVAGHAYPVGEGMTAEELEEHKRRMLSFCRKRNVAVDDTIQRLERAIERGGCEEGNTRLLIDSLRVIKKLTGK